MPTVDTETGVITDDAESEATAAENEHERAGESLAARYDRDEPSDDDAPEPEPEVAAAPEPAQLTQKQLEALGKRIDAAATKHENELRRILGDQFAEWMPCPLCMTDGHFQPIPAETRNPEQVQAVLAALGQDGYSELQPADWLVRCEKCNGKGRVRTPSDNPENAVVNCRDCASRGYNEKPIAPVASVAAWTPPPPPASAPSPWPNTGGVTDQWLRPIGHPHYGLDPVTVGVA